MSPVGALKAEEPPARRCAMDVDGAPPHTPPGYSPLIEAWATRPDEVYARSP